MAHQSQDLEALVEEQFIQSKTGNLDDCEDALHINEHFVAVIDGATSKTARRWNEETGGRIAVKIIRQAFDEMPGDYTAREAADLMTAMVHKCYCDYNALEEVKRDPNQRITASCAAVSLSRQEVWLIGDCHLLLGSHYISNQKKIDHLLSDVRALVIELEIQKGVALDQLRKNDTGRAFILPLLQEHTLFQNNLNAPAYWFPAVDGFTLPDAGIIITSIPDSVTTIVLATDGYPVLQDTLKDSERILQEILQKDPLVFREYKATKGMLKGYVSFDDRTFVKIRLKR
jgi:glycerophosphoryl diester phosphodiesterase